MYFLEINNLALEEQRDFCRITILIIDGILCAAKRNGKRTKIIEIKG